MPRFFVSTPPQAQTVLTGEDGRHLVRSLRVQIGEPLILCDGQGTDYHCTVSAICGDAVTVTVQSIHPSAGEPSVSVTLYQALPKSDKFDSVVQKAVELGVTHIVPMRTARCVSRPDAQAAQKKVVRWQKIAVEAAKQCGRGILPTVQPVTDFISALRQAQGTLLFCYEGGGAPIPQLLSPTATACALFIGPEGGFTPEEVQLAQTAGAKPATLGPRILRTETAPIAALAAIMLTTGNLN